MPRNTSFDNNLTRLPRVVGLYEALFCTVRVFGDVSRLVTKVKVQVANLSGIYDP